MRQNRYKCVSLFLSLLLALSLFSCLSLVAGAIAPQKIKVGYLENYGITTNKDSGLKSGYSYDYLMEISKHTGWDYELIPLGWSEGMEKLANGEIDIFGPLQKTPQRELVYDYSTHEMGFEYGTLYVNENNNRIFYNDLASFDGMRVAGERGNFHNERLEAFCQSNDISIEMVYADSTYFSQGLKNGDFDAVIFGSLMDIPNTVVVSKISAEPYYFATTKGNKAVLDGLNHALTLIGQENAYFAADLDRQYFFEKSVSMLAYTREETKFVQENPVLRVACDPTLVPTEYYDEQSGTFKGISIDVLNELGKISGLSFSYLKANSHEHGLEMLENGQADLVLGYTNQAEARNVRYTAPYLEVPVLLLGDKNVDLTKAQSVSMPNLNSETALAIMKRYPHFKYVNSMGHENAMETIRNQRTSLAFINAFSYDELARSQSLSRYVSLSTGITMSLCIGISDRLNPAVLEMLNKSIKRLDAQQINTIVFANTVNRVYKVPLSRTIKEYAVGIVAVLSVIFGIFFAILARISHSTQKRLKNVAYVDALTGISTLTKFKLDVAEQLKTATPGQYSLTCVDIDNFKYINDSCGYDAGDAVLKIIVAHFLAHTTSDMLLGRVSADNFVFFGRTFTHEEEVKQFDVLCNAKNLVRPILPEHYVLTFSMGIYVVNDPDGDFSLMLDKANLARKAIKGTHSNNFTEYTTEMDRELEWKKEVILAMESALIGQEFVTFLQPKYLFDDETIVGAEALARWNHPIRGLLSPASFIPIFEQNGFIKRLDFYIFEQVCMLLQRWDSTRKNVSSLVISVNLSRLHLDSPTLVEDLVALTQKYDVAPCRLEIELTESIVFHNTSALIDVMCKLRAAGFRLSIDDFGSGYSSLNLLKDLPVDVLKLDKGFLGESAADGNGRIIISKVIEMAKDLRLATVAEGVETKEQADMLAAMGCDIAQGYYYAKPMPLAEFEKRL